MALRSAARRLATQLPAWSAGAAEGCCSSSHSTAGPTSSAWFRVWYGARSFASLPPHVEMQMPSLSPTMSKGNISAWKKKEGDQVAAGDVLCDVETDKATMEWEAQDEGYLARILVGDGTQDIEVGTPVAVMVDDADSVAAFKDYKPGGGGQEKQSGGGEPSSGKDPSKGKPETSVPKDAGSGGGDEGGEEASGGGGDFPAHTVMGLPALSPTMQQGNIASWNKKAGEGFAAGDSLADIETDKATMTWEAQDEGFVAKILVEAGAGDVQVGQPVLIIVEDEGDIAAFESFTADDAAGKKAPPKKRDAAKEQPPDEGKAAEKTEAKAGPSAGEGKAPAPAKASGGRVAASPYAKKLAREAGVDYTQAKASGPGGRIVAADVQQLIESGGGKADQAADAGAGAAQPAAEGQDEGEWTDAKTSQIRRITAQRLLESKTTIPHYYLTVECSVDKLLQMRAQLNSRLAADGKKLSVNDFIIKASALAMRKVPEANASWHGDFIRQYHDVNVSVAVQTPAGLQVPVLRGADRLGLADISSGVKDIATKAKDGKLKPDQSQGGTFTVSNLGMFGITQFSAVVNPPQACILAVGGTEKRVVLLPTGGFGEASVMAVTLSCDHRIVDGAIGANWLAAFRGYLEDPTTMLL